MLFRIALALGVYGLLSPLYRVSPASGALGCGLLLVLLAVRPVRSRLAALARREVFVIAMLSSVIPFGLLELGAAVLARAGVVEVPPPMVTVVASGTDDWRFAHIVADEKREPDPVLLWRPKARPPFTSQRFKGAMLAVPKPAGTFRILTYGDSGTQGPDLGAWPEVLQGLLKPLEVASAGVSGYSSHQGLLRFRQEHGVYQPDLVLVSYGWNDPTLAHASDRAYVPPSRWVGSVLRVLLSFTAYRMLHGAVARAATPDGEPTVHRVAYDEYRENLRELARLARSTGAEVVFLSRPHRQPVAELEHDPGWRRLVPVYNRGLAELADDTGAHFIDVEGFFEGRAEVFVDECHLSLAGHVELARFVAAELERLKLLPPGATSAPP